MKIFLTIPLASKYDDIGKIIEQIIEEKKHELIRINEVISTSRVIDQIHDEIKKSDLVIADVSQRNANVMYELGYAQSLNKPVLPIIQKGESIPFDIASMRTLVYDRDRLNDTLGNSLKNYFSKSDSKSFIEKEFNENKNAKTVFVSYSHVDNAYLERLKVHLKPFEKSGKIDLWSDTKIKAGESWKKMIEQALKHSVIAVLLISADFLASDFIVDNELPPLLSAAEENGKIILPVIIKPCRFTKHRNLSKFQSINDPKYPLSKMNENDREETYVKIADCIDLSI